MNPIQTRHYSCVYVIFQMPYSTALPTLPCSYPTLLRPTIFYMFNLAQALNTTTTNSTIIITTLSNPDNSTHYYFPNCCYKVVKHTNR
jgi:hypothetical protein